MSPFGIHEILFEVALEFAVTMALALDLDQRVRTLDLDGEPVVEPA